MTQADFERMWQPLGALLLLFLLFAGLTIARQQEHTMDTTRFPTGVWIQLDTATTAAPLNTIVRDTTDGNLYVSTNATVPTYTQLTFTAGGQITALKQRVTLADLPAGTNTGTLAFDVGTTFPAGTLCVGGLVSLNATTNVGATGITDVDLTFGIGNIALTAGINVGTAIETVGVVGAPKFLDGFTNAADFVYGPRSLQETLQGFYQITSTGGNLNTLTAFDVTFYVFCSSTVITFP